MAVTPTRPAQKHTIRIRNRSRQTVPIQVNPPGGDFFLNEQQVHLRPGQKVDLPKDHVRIEQINNLSVRGILVVTYDSESLAEQHA